MPFLNSAISAKSTISFMRATESRFTWRMVPSVRAKSAHDGNLITFHRVKNFRELVY